MQKSRYEDKIRFLEKMVLDRNNEINELKQKILTMNNNILKPSQKKRKLDTGDKNNEDNNQGKIDNDESNAVELSRSKTINDELNTRLMQSLSTEMEESLRKRFKVMQEELVKIIDSKLDRMNSIQIKTYASTLQGNTSEGKNSPCDTANEEFKTIVMRAKNEELLEEKDKQERANNIIIHGRQETSEQQEDYQFVQHFINTTGGRHITSKSIVRLGKLTDLKARPIKVTIECLKDKGEIMHIL